MENKYYDAITRPLIDSARFSGANRLAAMLLNGMSVAVRAVLTLPALAALAPNYAAQRLREGVVRNPFKLLLCAALTLAACVVNSVIAAIAIMCVVAAIQLVPTVMETPTVLVAIVLLLVATVALVKAVISLFRLLLCTDTSKQQKPARAAEKPAKSATDEPVNTPTIVKVKVEKEEKQEDEEIEDLPFCQLFNISTEMVLLVDHVEMCPDETAFIRVVDEDGYTPLYKRKVRKDKQDRRYIAFNGEQLYLVPEKTKPIVSRKEKN